MEQGPTSEPSWLRASCHGIDATRVRGGGQCFDAWQRRRVASTGIDATHVRGGGQCFDAWQRRRAAAWHRHRQHNGDLLDACMDSPEDQATVAEVTHLMNDAVLTC